MANVTLINPFEVPPERETEFLECWKHVTEFLRTQPGFLSSELHRSRDPHARFRFTNVTTWESPEHFHNALQKPELVELMDRMSFPHYPALYDLFLHWRRDDSPWRREATRPRKESRRAVPLGSVTPPPPPF